MIAVKLMKSAVNYLPEINQATLSGAIDVIVTESPEGDLRSTPFHVRFGKFHILRPKDRVVSIQVNGEMTELRMKLGQSGEAFFCSIADDNSEADDSLKTSPMVSPTNSAAVAAALVNLDLEPLPPTQQQAQHQIQISEPKEEEGGGGGGGGGGGERRREEEGGGEEVTWKWGSLPTPTHPDGGMLLTDYISQLEDAERRMVTTEPEADSVTVHVVPNATRLPSDDLRSISRDVSAEAPSSKGDNSRRVSKDGEASPAIGAGAAGGEGLVDSTPRSTSAGGGAGDNEKTSNASGNGGSWVGSLFRWRSYKSDGGSSDQGKNQPPTSSNPSPILGAAADITPRASPATDEVSPGAGSEKPEMRVGVDETDNNNNNNTSNNNNNEENQTGNDSPLISQSVTLQDGRPCSPQANWRYRRVRNRKREKKGMEENNPSMDSESGKSPTTAIGTVTALGNGEVSAVGDDECVEEEEVEEEGEEEEGEEDENGVPQASSTAPAAAAAAVEGRKGVNTPRDVDEDGEETFHDAGEGELHEEEHHDSLPLERRRKIVFGDGSDEHLDEIDENNDSAHHEEEFFENEDENVETLHGVIIEPSDNNNNNNNDRNGENSSDRTSTNLNGGGSAAAGSSKIVVSFLADRSPERNGDADVPKKRKHHLGKRNCSSTTATSDHHHHHNGGGEFVISEEEEENLASDQQQQQQQVLTSPPSNHSLPKKENFSDGRLPVYITSSAFCSDEDDHLLSFDSSVPPLPPADAEIQPVKSLVVTSGGGGKSELQDATTPASRNQPESSPSSSLPPISTASSSSPPLTMPVTSPASVSSPMMLSKKTSNNVDEKGAVTLVRSANVSPIDPQDGEGEMLMIPSSTPPPLPMSPTASSSPRSNNDDPRAPSNALTSTVRALVSPRVDRASNNNNNINDSNPEAIFDRRDRPRYLQYHLSVSSHPRGDGNGFVVVDDDAPSSPPSNNSQNRKIISYSPPSSPPARRAASLPPPSPASSASRALDNDDLLANNNNTDNNNNNIKPLARAGSVASEGPNGRDRAESKDKPQKSGIDDGFLSDTGSRVEVVSDFTMEAFRESVSKGMPVIEMAICKQAPKNAVEKDIEKIFDSSLVSPEAFLLDPLAMANNPQLYIRMQGRIMPARVALPVVLSLLAFNFAPSLSSIDRKAQKSSWMGWLWSSSKSPPTGPANSASAPVPPPLNADNPEAASSSTPSAVVVQQTTTTTTTTTATTTSAGAVGGSDEGSAVVAAAAAAASGENGAVAVEEKVVKEKKKTVVMSLCPSSEQLKQLQLHFGANRVQFLLQNTYVEATIYKWHTNSKIVVSDIDGTITKSDVLGHLLPLVGADWSQCGVAGLLSRIKKNGYHLLYLTARPIGQVSRTKTYLQSLQQDGYTLPEGPVFTSPDRLMHSFHREVIRRQPQEFKIACLKNVAALFPSCPFHAGFGNRGSDVESYRAVGVPAPRIFTVNSQGNIKNACNMTYSTTYTSLQTLVDLMFAPVTAEKEIASCEYNDYNYWRRPMYFPPPQEENKGEEKKKEDSSEDGGSKKKEKI